MFWNKVKFLNGVLPDTRSDKEKAKDYKQSELVTAPAPVVWTRKTSYRSFPKRMQNGSGSCANQGLEKERGIMAFLNFGEFVDFSSYTYQLRQNPFISGSNKLDRIIYANNGSVPEVLLPSRSMTDQQMLDIKVSDYYKEISKISGCYSVDVDINIDTIASTIEATGKGVGVWFRFSSGEWFNRKEVRILNNDLTWGHAVVAVDYTLNDKGEKCLVIEDSACEDGYPQRLVPESFFNARCFLASYLVNFKKYVELPSKPSFNGSITSLQDILKYEGLFPSNQQSTGIFGPITKSALIKFQLKYNISPASGVFGTITKAKLYELFP
jgi:hypothetical protein